MEPLSNVLLWIIPICRFNDMYGHNMQVSDILDATELKKNNRVHFDYG